MLVLQIGGEGEGTTLIACYSSSIPPLRNKIQKMFFLLFAQNNPLKKTNKYTKYIWVFCLGVCLLFLFSLLEFHGMMFDWLLLI